jgi:hypothetical protein
MMRHAGTPWCKLVASVSSSSNTSMGGAVPARTCRGGAEDFS